MRKPLSRKQFMALRRIVAANIFWYRSEQKLSQDALALASGMHRTYVSLVERALVDPTVTSLSRLAWALEVNPAKLLRPGRTFTPPKKRGRRRKPRP